MAPAEGEEQEQKRDIRFGSKLAASDKAVRDKAVKVLSRWLAKQEDIGEADLLKIWKGLFYCMWHSDKPVVQMELAGRLASMMHVFPGDRGLLYYGTFLATMCREWERIDRLRIEKYYALVRKFVEAGFAYAARRAWGPEVTKRIAGALAGTVLEPSGQAAPVGLALHVAEVFVPALAACEPPAGTDALATLLEPCLALLGRSQDKRLFGRVRDSIFEAIAEGYSEAHAPAKDKEEEEEEEEEEEAGPKGPSPASKLAQAADVVAIAKDLFRLAASKRTREAYRSDIHKLRKTLVKAIRSVDAEAAAEADKLEDMEEEDEPENEEAARKRKRREAEKENKEKKRRKRAEEKAAARAAAEAEEAEANRDVAAERLAERKAERKANRLKKKEWVAPWKEGGGDSGGSGAEEGEEARPAPKRPKAEAAEGAGKRRRTAEGGTEAKAKANGAQVEPKKKADPPKANGAQAEPKKPAPPKAQTEATRAAHKTDGPALEEGEAGAKKSEAGAKRRATEGGEGKSKAGEAGRRPSLDKRVSFDLKANTQKLYPRGSPFAGSPLAAKRNLAKSPTQGVLKPSPPPKALVSALGAKVEVGRAPRG